MVTQKGSVSAVIMLSNLKISMSDYKSILATFWRLFAKKRYR